MQKTPHRAYTSLMTISALVPTFWILLGLINPAFLAYTAQGLYAATTVPAAVLAAPTATCAGTVQQVQLSWSAVSGATGYSVFRSPSPTTTWTTLSSKQTGTTFTDASLASGTYQYQVKTYSGLRSSYSNIVSISVPVCPALATAQPNAAVTSAVKVAPAPVASAPASPTSLQWGAYTGDTVADLAPFETMTGKAANMLAFFIGFGDPLPDGISALKLTNKTLVIFWEPISDLDSINNGTWDTYMKTFAASAKKYGGPIILAPFHEMNGNWDIWDGTVGTNSPAKLIAAWKRAHDIFVAAGATNVKWGWAVNNESVPNTAANSIASYYPGDAYVDIVGVDGFNMNGVDGWLSFSQIFNTALAQLKAYNKPVYIFSMASAPDVRKAAWITDALTTQILAHPEIKGWLWFNQNKEQNWLINSDSASLSAFKTAITLIK